MFIIIARNERRLDQTFFVYFNTFGRLYTKSDMFTINWTCLYKIESVNTKLDIVLTLVIASKIVDKITAAPSRKH